MLLGNTLSRHLLGRSWRLNQKRDFNTYVGIVEQFLDVPGAKYSIHNISLKGECYDKKV